MSTLIVGCGYLGCRVGQSLRRRGGPVFGTVRALDRAAELPAWGIDPLLADTLDPQTLRSLPDVERAVDCVSPRRPEGVRNLLDRLDGRVRQFVLISTTGVYGQADGSWVDEESETEPATTSGQLNLEAERLVLARPGLDAVILRLAGLYGPGRLPHRARLERGQPVPGNPDHWLNLLHIEDAARFVAAALVHPAPARIYNVSDDQPVPRRRFYERLARLLDAPKPSFDADAATPRDASHKRVRSHRIKRDFRLECLYPNHERGLSATLAAERHGDQSIGAGSM